MTIYSGFFHKQWWFSIVMWQFTRGYGTQLSFQAPLYTSNNSAASACCRCNISLSGLRVGCWKSGPLGENSIKARRKHKSVAMENHGNPWRIMEHHLSNHFFQVSMLVSSSKAHGLTIVDGFGASLAHQELFPFRKWSTACFFSINS